MGIQGNTSLMLLKTKPDHPHYEKLKNSEQYVIRGSELTKQLLGFARRGKYQVHPTNLNALITESSNLFGRTNKEVAIHLELERELSVVSIDRGQIEQVLLNLLMNAWQAMPGGGSLRLKTENVTLDSSRVQGREARPGKYVKTSVIDTGIGMDAKTMQRIFDPFFTTKAPKQGTGLGLAVSYGIVQEHSGKITVDSKPGDGTSFRVELPLVRKSIHA